METETMKPKIIFPFTKNSDNLTHDTITEYTKFGYIKEGKEFLDTSLGNCGSFMLGFDRTDILDSVNLSLRDIPFVSGEYMSSTAATVELSERLYNISDRFYSFYSTSGSDAIEGAIKAARVYHMSRGNNDKHIVLGISESYHGSTYLSSSVSGGSFMTRNLGRSNLCKTIPRSDNSDILLKNVANKIDEYRSENISCLVIESCSWLGGVTPYNDKFWESLKILCEKNDILLVIDDIAMCGGKTGKMLGFDIRPDIFVMGKALSGGYFPLSVCLVSEEVFETIKEEFWTHGFTYSFSLSGIYSTIKYLNILESEKIFDNYTRVYNTALSVIDNLVKDNVIKSYTNYGLYFNLKFHPVSDILLAQKYFFENGLNVGIQNYEWKGLRVIIPLTANNDYFDQLDSRLRCALRLGA